jgi:hypothetical protein
MAIDPPHIEFKVINSGDAHKLVQGHSFHPGQLVKGVVNPFTGHMEMVPYDGVGDAIGIMNSNGQVTTTQPHIENKETTSVPRGMVKHPELFQRDSIAGDLYRRDLVAELQEHVVYERNLMSRPYNKIEQDTNFYIAQLEAKADARAKRLEEWLKS